MKFKGMMPAAAPLLAAGVAGAEEVHVYNWSAYIDESGMNRFLEQNTAGLRSVCRIPKAAKLLDRFRQLNTAQP